MNQNENLFVPASMGYDQEMVPKTKDWVERVNPDSKLPNFNIGRILVLESQVVNESLKLTETPNTPESSKDSEAESLTPLPPLKNLQGASPSSEMLIDEKVNSTQKTQESNSQIQQTESSKSIDSSKISQDSKPKVHNVGSSKSLRPKPIQKPQLSSDIDGFCNGGEHPRMVQIGSLSYFQDHKWYDELMDGKPKDETLTLKIKVEKSWGDATPDNVGGSTNQIFGASNVGSTRENQAYNEHMGNETPEQSVCKIRRFEMMKYSFSDNEEYITIKESDHLNHSKKGLDAYRELLRLTNEGWVVTTPDE
ncbi:hypothetical protein Tco_1482309 [Tanacetum coccineum]